MSLSTVDLTVLLLALIVLLAFAHAGGQLFVRFRQPRVAGEIIGGLVLGPTLMGAVLPHVHDALFRPALPTATVLGAFYQLGLFMLMFCTGAALRAGARAAERRTVVVVAALGNLVPFVAGLLFLVVVKPQNLVGTAHNETAFVLVFGCAIAVTSVPVISKIMADLGIMGTRFARIVLSIAVIEDVVLFVVISIALGMVQGSAAQTLSLPGLLGIMPNTALSIIYYIAASATFFSLPLVLGRGFMQRVASMRGNILASSSPVAFQLLFALAITALALMLGVAAYFGAFVAGMLAGELDGAHARAHEAIKSFSFAVFIPVYFAIVGLQLDLQRQLDVLFFVGFLAYACVVKATSVYAGSRLAGHGRSPALNLAIALNARGGPAIVLASVTFAAHIISGAFFVSLVLMALVTSMMAGAWLDWVLRRRVRSDDLLEDQVDVSVEAFPSAVAESTG